MAMAVLAGLGLVLASGLAARAAEAPEAAAAITPLAEFVANDHDRAVLTGFIRHAVEYARGLTPEKVKERCAAAPEMFAWVEFRYLNCLNVAYQLTRDPQCLDLFADRFQLFRDAMRTEHDEYLGWYGLPIKDRIPADRPDLQIDELQMNFRAISLLALWVELARENPEYAARQAKTIAAYLDLMEKQLYPKWDRRGHFALIEGRGGVYHGLDFPIQGQPTLSFEKLSIMVDALLKLHRVTGQGEYLRRALQVGAWFKSNLMLVDGHYEWMSWVPAGKWDIHPTREDSWWPSWIAPDPRAEWYVASLSIALNLYQHGLLFTDEDLARFLATQKTRCWNGDLEKPEYRNVAGKQTRFPGRFLSMQLAHYDPALAKLAFAGPHEAEALANAANSWKGGANAQDYVREKYLMAPRIKAKPRPWAGIGEAFLADPANRAFYDGIFVAVTGSGAAPPPRKPSEAPWLRGEAGGNPPSRTPQAEIER